MLYFVAVAVSFPIGFVFSIHLFDVTGSLYPALISFSYIQFVGPSLICDLYDHFRYGDYDFSETIGNTKSTTKFVIFMSVFTFLMGNLYRFVYGS